MDNLSPVLVRLHACLVIYGVKSLYDPVEFDEYTQKVAYCSDGSRLHGGKFQRHWGASKDEKKSSDFPSMGERERFTWSVSECTRPVENS